MITNKRLSRKKRMAHKVEGTAKRPRLSVYKSNKYIYGQVIDDSKGVTLAQAWGLAPEEVGEKIAAETKRHKISKVTFDRGGFVYHGRVKALADAARKGGLEF